MHKYRDVVPPLTVMLMAPVFPPAQSRFVRVLLMERAEAGCVTVALAVTLQLGVALSVTVTV